MRLAQVANRLRRARLLAGVATLNAAKGLDPAAAQLRQTAVDLMRRGEVDEAIGAFEALTRVAPSNPDDWYNMGYLQRSAHRFGQSLQSYDQALTLGISSPEAVYVNRAAIFSDHLFDPVAAEGELNKALAISPDYVPALLNAANMKEDQGDRDAACVLYRRVLAIDPDVGRAVARLAMLELGQIGGETIAAQLERQLSKTTLLLDDRGEIGFALGHVQDYEQRFDDAFAAFTAANVNSRRAWADRIVPYDPVAHEELIDKIIEAFPNSSHPVSRATDDAPVFVCGMFRSGSTLAEQILARHPRVTPGGELSLLPKMVTELQPFPETVSRLGKDALTVLHEKYLNDVRTLFPNYDLLTDKRPDNFLLIGFIKCLFPRARFVHTFRNALDNALSIYFMSFDPSVSYATDLSWIAHYYEQYQRLMAHWNMLYSDDIYNFDYDLLVQSPDVQIRALIEAAGLIWDPICLRAGPTGIVRTPTTWQVRQPIHDRSSNRWTNYEYHLFDLKQRLMKAGNTLR